ncbi:Uncharacterised protein [Bordetella pertussis]|nr:Uncharacterised protein [Bordetella pertussis]CFP52414.1 Uncharacterised protein [Bordetella pertussis]CPH78736.1 Uncharacterised protein [Bordetella pertussis]CPI02556.1 Uncharacterised protein [Bordetella pertussis]CRE04665.1 Uncharacterised protein [Bordetella pertussis]
MSSQKCGLSKEKPIAPSSAAPREGMAWRATSSPPSERSARRADCSAYQARKATPNHRMAWISQGNQPVSVCSPQTLPKMKTASIRAHTARMLSRCARISPWRRMKALCAPTTANSPRPVAAPLAQAVT